MSDKLYNKDWKPGDGVLAPGNRSFDKKESSSAGSGSKPNPYTAAKAKDKNLDSYIKTRNASKKGTREYAIAQNKINEAYGVSKRYDVPDAVKPKTPKMTKGLNGPEVERTIKPKSKAEVEAYANDKSNFAGKTQYEAMGNSGQSSSPAPQNKAVGKNDNITKLTGPQLKTDLDAALKKKFDDGSASSHALSGMSLKTGNNTAQKSTLNAKPGSRADNSGSSPKKPMRTSLGEGVGSGMAMIDNSMKSMARMTGDMTGGGKGLFGGIKERRAAKQAQTPDPTKTTLKAKDTPDIASNTSSGAAGSSGGNYLDELEGPGSKTFGM